MDHGKRRLHMTLAALTVITLFNLLLTASVVGLLCCIVILVMVWGIRRGDYPLSTALFVFLYLYGTVNLVVLGVTLLSGAAASVSSLVWLALYSAGIFILGGLLRSRAVREYLKTARPPAEKEKKIHFFRGGWRDL